MNVNVGNTWQATGKVRIVPFMGGIIPALEKSPLIGDWKYKGGVLRRTVLFGLKEYDLKSEIDLVEISSARVLTDTRTSTAITPSNLAAWATSPLIGMLYEAAKRNQLSREPLVTIYTKNGGMADMYVNQAIFQELVDNCEVREVD